MMRRKTMFVHDYVNEPEAAKSGNGYSAEELRQTQQVQALRQSPLGRTRQQPRQTPAPVQSQIITQQTVRSPIPVMPTEDSQPLPLQNYNGRKRTSVVSVVTLPFRAIYSVVEWFAGENIQAG